MRDRMKQNYEVQRASSITSKAQLLSNGGKHCGTSWMVQPYYRRYFPTSSHESKEVAIETLKKIMRDAGL